MVKGQCLLLLALLSVTLAKDLATIEKRMDRMSSLMEKVEETMLRIEEKVSDVRSLVCPKDPPPLKEHLKRVWDGITRLHGYNIVYDCNLGYVFDPQDDLSVHVKDGLFIVTCLNGQWTHSATPKCVPGCRGAPPAIIHVNSEIPPRGPSVWDGSRISGTSMQYQCVEGHIFDPLNPLAKDIINNVFTITCTNGTWFPLVVPQCLKACAGKPPTREDIEYVGKDHDVWADGMTMEYKCQKAPEKRFYPLSEELLGNPSNKISSSCVDGEWVPNEISTPCTPNLAYKRPAEQVSDFQGLNGEHPGFKAEYAVDGLMRRAATKLYISDGDTATAVPDVWWTVDLGESKTVSSLVVYQTDDEFCIHFHDIKVYVSDTPKSSADFKENNSDLCVTYENFPRGINCHKKRTIMRCGKPVTGRYVSIVSNKRIFGCEYVPIGIPCSEGLTGVMGLHMAEVEVYSDPSN